MIALGSRATPFTPPQFAAAVACMLALVVPMALFTTPYMVVGAFSHFVLTLGILIRRNRVWHPRFMLTGIALDLAIVAVLEFSRGAINVAMGPTMTPFQLAHVLTSSVAAALYVPVVVLGVKMLKRSAQASANLRPWHLRLGIAAYVFRTLGFLLMFSLLGRNPG